MGASGSYQFHLLRWLGSPDPKSQTMGNQEVHLACLVPAYPQEPRFELEEVWDGKGLRQSAQLPLQDGQSHVTDYLIGIHQKIPD